MGRAPAPWSPHDKRFGWRHGIAWLLYVGVVLLNLKLLQDARRSSGLTLLPAVLLAWVAVLTAAGCIERWLDGANRHWALRLALVLSAMLSCMLGLWMLWHYGVFLLVGLVTLFQRPMELITLTLFAERLGLLLLAVATFAIFAWLSLRVVLVLLSGERQANFEQVLGEESFGEPPLPVRPLDPPDPPSARPPQLVNLGFSVRKPFHPGMPTGKQIAAAKFMGPPRPPRPPEPPGKQRYLQRPPELTPRPVGTSGHFAPPVLHGLTWHGHSRAESARRCQALGWPAFEWVFRAQPGLEELSWALDALPHLAPVLDDDDAAEVREWLSRLADHPGQFEREIPSQERDGLPRDDLTVRIAGQAFNTLMLWDQLRRQ
jgi:hypothetical protein